MSDQEHHDSESINSVITEAEETQVANEPAEQVTVDYPKLPPRRTESIGPEQYIMERFNSSIKWYDDEAGSAKNKFLRLRLLTVIGGAIVPVLINLDIPYLNIITTIVSLLVVLAVSVDSVYHHGDQWSTYRSTEQFMRREYFLYTANNGPYKGLSEPQAYKLFVERIEEAIAAENSSSLRILATVSESSSTAGGTSDQSGGSDIIN